MDYPLISVIVPIYKVEKYLEQCVRSIQKQTYPNIEIILVDDGSPDHCGAICDFLAAMDPRIVVIHKENGGLSSARNEGLSLAKGIYFGFVDSDDCIHPQMYEQLFNDILRYGTPLAFCQSNIYSQGLPPMVTVEDRTIVYTAKDLINTCLKNEKWFCAWSKLYHCSLKKYVHFPEGRTNEDYAIMLMVYDKCGKIAVNNNKLYNYCRREGSITAAPKLRNYYDSVLSAKEEYAFIKKYYPESAKFAFRILIANIYSLVYHGLHTNDKSLLQECRFYDQYLKKNRWNILKLSVMSIGQRLLILSLTYGKFIHDVVYRISQNIKR